MPPRARFITAATVALGVVAATIAFTARSTGHRAPESLAATGKEASSAAVVAPSPAPDTQAPTPLVSQPASASAESGIGLPWGPPPASVTVADALLTSVGIFPAPGAPPTGTLKNPNSLGYKLVFLVREQQGGWLKVALPMRPNGSTAWIQATDVALRQVPYWILINTSAHHLTVYEAGAPVFEARVAVGTASTPTPTGDFYIDGVFKLAKPTGPYGAYALSVTGFSNVLHSFAGGNGQIAMHGTNNPGLIGTPASHGCVRMTNADVIKLQSMVPAGTPVTIIA